MLNEIFVNATNIPDAWFQSLYKCIELGRDFIIDRGSFEQQKRLEFDYITVKINNPGFEPLLPELSPLLGLPNPVDKDYLDDYLPYLMTGEEKEGESYTYGQRICRANLDTSLYENGWKVNSDHIINEIDTLEENIIVDETKGKLLDGTYSKKKFINQMELMIWTYKNKGYRNNQMVLQVAQPSDMLLTDPPCLRHIDTRIQDDKLHFFPYFRCLVGDTNIIARVDGKVLSTNISEIYNLFNKNKKIEVVSVDKGFSPIWGNVTDVSIGIKNNVVTLDIVGGGSIELTEDHKIPIYSDGEIIEKQVKDLNEGDIVLECKDLISIREFTFDYIDILDVLKDHKNVYVDKLTIEDFKTLNKNGVNYIESHRDAKRLPFNIAYNSFLKDIPSLKCCCQKLKNIDRMFKISEEMSYFMGLWLADGWYNNNGNALRLVIEKSNERKLNRVLNFLDDEFDYSPSVEERDGCVVINIGILFLAKLFIGLGFIHGSKVKYVPEFVFNLSENLLYEFFSGWFSGDAGCSTSPSLTNDFSTLLKLVGECYSVYTEKPRKAFFKKEDREISASKSYRILPTNKYKGRLCTDENFIKRKVKNISKISKETTVYDLSVDTDSHLFSCGTTPILVHNSWDLYGGFPANLAAIELMKQYCAGQIGVENGEIIASSKGLHLYSYVWEIAEAIRGRTIEEFRNGGF